MSEEEWKYLTVPVQYDQENKEKLTFKQATKRRAIVFLNM